MNPGYLKIKRVFDVVSSCCAIFIFLIPWIVISIVIKIQSPGPAIYKAQRVGMGGKIFTMYKFRSMRVENGNIHATTLRGDPRIFPFGQFLRNSKLDETPQLINILKGQMSVIGPRPEDKVNAGQLYVGKYRNILSVKPGLSSPASLYDYTHGEMYPNEESYIRDFVQKKLDVELYYIRHRNTRYDFQIICRTIVTIAAVLAGKRDFEKPVEARRLRL